MHPLARLSHKYDLAPYTQFRQLRVSSDPALYGKLLPLTYVSTGILLPFSHTPTMGTSWPSTNLLRTLSEENYDGLFSAYRHWIELEAARVGVTNRKLYNDVLGSTRPDLISLPYVIGGMWSNGVGGNLIHDKAQLLLRFISDAGQDPTLSTYAVGLHEQLCRSSLDEFFGQILAYILGSSEAQLSEFYTRTNLIAHWVNLGYVKLKDVRDRILQSLTMNPTPLPYQLNSLMILLKISGATFAAYVDPSVMDRCCDLLKPSNLGYKLVLTGLAEVRVLISTTQTRLYILELQEVLRLRENGWEGLPLPPTLRSVTPEAARLQDPAATPVAISLGLPGMTEQPQTPTLLSPVPETPSDRNPEPSTPPSPSTSITTMSDFTIADDLDDEPIPGPEIITPHDTFYLADGSVEIVCGKTLFRIHSSTLSFHSPVLRKMFSPENLVAAESPNGCPRIVSSDIPADFATFLKIVYLPE